MSAEVEKKTSSFESLIAPLRADAFFSIRGACLLRADRAEG